MARDKTIIIKIDVSEKNASSKIKKTKKAVDDLAKSTKGLAKANNENRAQSGLNNAILIESGRVASDAAYGIQGMANNIGRLVELGQEFARTNKEKGLGGALQDLKKSFFGVGGILIGLQLFLSFLPQIVKLAKSGAFSLKEMSKEFKILSGLTEVASENAQSLIGNFKLYTSIITNAKESEEQRAIAIKKLNDEYPDFNTNILIEASNTREATLAIDEYVKALKRRALSQAAEQEFRKISGEIIAVELQRELDLQEEREEFLEKSNRAIIKQERLTGEAIMVSQEEKSKAYVDSVRIINEAADEEIAKQQEKLDFLITLIDLENKEVKNRKNNSQEKQKYDALEIEGFDRKIAALKEMGRIRKFFFNQELRFDVMSEENSIKAIERERQQNISRLNALKEAGLVEADLALAKYQVNLYYNKLLAKEQEELDRRGFAMRLEMFNNYANALGSISQLFEKNSKAAKIFALAEIAAQTAIGFAQGLTLAQQQAKEAAPISALAFPLFYSSQIAAVLAAAARAKSILSGGSPGGSGQAKQVSVEAPDFNVVGASPESQLAQSVAAQQTKPLKAFVVGKEITSQQELDRNILTTAGLGD